MVIEGFVRVDARTPSEPAYGVIPRGARSDVVSKFFTVLKLKIVIDIW